MLTTKNVDRTKLTAMFLQYAEVKDKFPNDIVLFRVGDFFEAYFEDALLFSNLGEVTFTSKRIGSKDKVEDKNKIKPTFDDIMNSQVLIPMAGVPHKSLMLYANKLLKEGHRIVVVEQLEDPKTVKNGDLVKRGVVKILSVIDMDGEYVEDYLNNFICSIYKENNIYGLCFTDVGTNDVYLTVVDSLKGLFNEIGRYKPNEIILNNEVYDLIGHQIEQRLKIKPMLTIEDCAFDLTDYINKILKSLHIENIEDIKYNNIVELKSLCIMINYIDYTQKLDFEFSKLPNSYISENYLEIDSDSRLNLELSENLKDGSKMNSLLYVLDNCKTNMGKRLLKQWLDKPLQKKDLIEKRLDAVSELCSDGVVLENIQSSMCGILDISRIIGRLKLRKSTPKDLVNLRESFKLLPEVYQFLSRFNSNYLKELYEKMDVFEDIVFLLDKAIIDNPVSDIKEGIVIKSGYNSELDKARDMVENANKYMVSFEEKERERTGIKNLKVENKNNKYTIEVTKVNESRVPSDYRIERALKNATRYTTDELENLEKDIITAQERSKSIEIDLYEELKELILNDANKILTLCDVISTFDVLSSFASISLKYHYVRPNINTEGNIKILDGRHPVVERFSKKEFIPNNFKINMGINSFFLITGPNMAGKSTYMRQVALITIMAHIGCFVPASYADICIVDKIFTRIGASDDISSGRSTYMVEMTEVKNILENATKQSLVLLDEVGRGTSTSDGLSIAQAVTEYIVKNIGCKTLFATHYHELIALEESLNSLKNYHMSVSKTEDGLEFLRKIEDGGLSESYGIDVAELAGLPQEIIKRAWSILGEIEHKKDYIVVTDTSKNDKIIEKLKGIDKRTLSPTTAYKYLFDLIEML